jgi:hypothetical protein
VTEHEKPKRLTHSQILEMLLLNRAAQRCQVTLSVQANGDVLAEVRAVADDVQDAEAAALAALARLRPILPSATAMFEPGKVGLTRNAKGETQIDLEVKSDGTRGLSGVADDAAEEYERLRARFPLANGTVSADAPTLPARAAKA